MTQEFRAPARFGLLGLLIALSVLVIGCNRQVAMPAQGDKPAGEPTSTASKLSEPTITPTAAPAPAVTGTPTYTMVTISSTRPPLTVEEYVIASTTAPTWSKDAMYDLVEAYEEQGWMACPPEDLAPLFDRRRPWRVQAARERITETNRVLAPHGYRLVEQDERSSCFPPDPRFSYALYQGEERLASDLTHVHPLSVNVSGTDFALLLSSAQGSVFLRSGSLERWASREQLEHAYTSPVFVGDDLITVKHDPLKTSRQFTVWRGTAAVYTYTSNLHRAEYRVNTLRSWEGKWVLEIDEQVIVDGESLNEQLGYDAIFHWRLLQGRPFYLFRQGDQVGIFYAGEVLPRRYDAVLHNLCCGYALFNPGGNERMVWFHAWKDGTWVYVEAGYYADVD